MLDSPIFDFLAFPWIVIQNDRSTIYRASTALFPEYTEYSEDSRADAVAARKGWSLCRHGLAIYKRPIDFGNADLAFYHLKISGITTFHGKKPEGQLSLKTSSDNFEKYVASFLQTTLKMGVFVHRLSHQTIHDIRHLNGEIQSKCDSLLKLSQQGYVDAQQLDWLARNVQALSEMMSASADFLEVVANPRIGYLARNTVGVYKKFDKARKALQESKRYGEGKFIRLIGTSENRINALSVFDVIPFIALQNAMKYSPPETSIEIFISDVSGGVDVSIEHLGTIVEDGEFEKIFSPGFRTKSARQHANGNGLGLYFLKKLIELHEGCTVFFNQVGQTVDISERCFRRTELRMHFSCRGTGART